MCKVSRLEPLFSVPPLTKSFHYPNCSEIRKSSIEPLFQFLCPPYGVWIVEVFMVRKADIYIGLSLHRGISTLVTYTYMLFHGADIPFRPWIMIF